MLRLTFRRLRSITAKDSSINRPPNDQRLMDMHNFGGISPINPCGRQRTGTCDEFATKLDDNVGPCYYLHEFLNAKRLAPSPPHATNGEKRDRQCLKQPNTSWWDTRASNVQSIVHPFWVRFPVVVGVRCQPGEVMQSARRTSHGGLFVR